MNIIFDFGNVLVEWEPERVYLPYFNHDRAKYDHFWQHICDADFRNRIDCGEPPYAVVRAWQARFPAYAEAIGFYMSRWEETLPGEMPGMRTLIEQLKAVPTNHLYGLTNWSMATFPQARQRFKVLQLIDNYVVSGAEGVVKPNPAIFHILLNRYGLQAEECLFVDDNPDNVASACRLGFRGLQFQGAASLRQQLRPYLPNP